MPINVGGGEEGVRSRHRSPFSVAAVAGVFSATTHERYPSRLQFAFNLLGQRERIGLRGNGLLAQAICPTPPARSSLIPKKYGEVIVAFNGRHLKG